MNAQTPMATPADLIAQYVWLRNKKKEQEEKFKEFLATNYGAPMEALEQALLDHLKATKVDNVSAKGIGTAYRNPECSVTVADQREFQRHVIGSEAWELIDWRANKTAVKKLVAANEPLPPGVNYTAWIGIGIRKG